MAEKRSSSRECLDQPVALEICEKGPGQLRNVRRGGVGVDISRDGVGVAMQHALR